MTPKSGRMPPAKWKQFSSMLLFSSGRTDSWYRGTINERWLCSASTCLWLVGFLFSTISVRAKVASRQARRHSYSGWRTKKINLSSLICFEDVFPHLVRKYVARDTDFLLNLTNNGWFGESAA